jgi:hypothetical protein
MSKCTLPVLAITGLLSAQSAPARSTAPFSRQFLQVKAYSQEENEAPAEKYEGLRTTDVADALQMVGLHGVRKGGGFARKIRDDDNKVRQRQYEKLGRPPGFHSRALTNSASLDHGKRPACFHARCKDTAERIHETTQNIAQKSEERSQ